MVVPVSVVVALTSISVSNDAAARAVEGELLALPLPAGAERLDSLSRAAKVTGNGNGMQYLGAILIRSDVPLSELDSFYARNPGHDGPAAVIATTDADAVAGFHGAGGFFDDPGEDGVYIVYSFGDAPSELHELLDVRGH